MQGTKLYNDLVDEKIELDNPGGLDLPQRTCRKSHLCGTSRSTKCTK
jgi:hypothetical protein